MLDRVCRASRPRSPIKIIPISADKVNEFKEEYLYKNKSLIVGFGIVALFFVVVMANILISGSYEKTHNKLQYQVNSKRQYVVELTKLEEDLRIKEQFIQSSGVARASRVSYYTDQIGLSIPESIQLNQLFVNPLTKRINKAEDIITIDLKGKSSMADYMIIASGTSSRHLQSLSEQVLKKLKDNGIKNSKIEGKESSERKLVDEMDLIIHILQPEKRRFYELEKFGQS